MKNVVRFGLPQGGIWNLPRGEVPLAVPPFENKVLQELYKICMKPSTPMTIAVVYFSMVHLSNKIVRQRQLRKAAQEKKVDSKSKLGKKEMKRLPAAPYAVAQTYWFNIFVFLHNVFLCVYSVWTFVGMCGSLYRNVQLIKPLTSSPSRVQNFFQTVCDLKYGSFSNIHDFDSLQLFGFWFYVSKFYEVVDTAIILLKGKPSSLLQSYHHAGAMLCMWAGIRYQSPPIWIFVVFNSFIHSLMYFYFSLACLKIRVPSIFKRALTSLQITQFVVGGSLAVVHAFVWYTDFSTLNLVNCISSSDQALPLIINVAYLAPLTALFAAFYIESYMRKTSK